MPFDYELWMPWMSRAGIVLNFLSFWLVAPEFIGEERLQKFERKLGGGLVFVLPKAVWLVVYLVMATGMMVVFALLFFAVLALLFHFPGIRFEGFSLYGLVVFFLILAVAFANRSGRWAERRLAQPLLTKLANDDNARGRYLAAGILMFILGNALSFAATFRPSP